MINRQANDWRYNDETGDEQCSLLAFTAQRATTFRGRRYRAGEELCLDLPRAITRASLDDMAGNGGPWGWGGYTGRQLRALEAGEWSDNRPNIKEQNG